MIMVLKLKQALWTNNFFNDIKIENNISDYVIIYPMNKIIEKLFEPFLFLGCSILSSSSLFISFSSLFISSSPLNLSSSSSLILFSSLLILSSSSSLFLLLSSSILSLMVYNKKVLNYFNLLKTTHEDYMYLHCLIMPMLQLLHLKGMPPLI